MSPHACVSLAEEVHNTYERDKGLVEPDKEQYNHGHEFYKIGHELAHTRQQCAKVGENREY